MSNESDSMEKEYDDQVYEDEYYEENYDEEELEDDHDSDSEKKVKSDDDDDDGVEEKHIHVSFACEDCDYRWDDVIVKIKGGNLEDEADDDFSGVACPMCGSTNVEQI